MKKLILMCAIVLGFAFNASAQDNQKAEFKFNEEKHDFGKIPQGKPVTTDFVFTNIGEEPLILTEVKPTCGCTIADYTKTPVKKGIESGEAISATVRETLLVKMQSKTKLEALRSDNPAAVATPEATTEVTQTAEELEANTLYGAALKGLK